MLRNSSLVLVLSILPEVKDFSNLNPVISLIRVDWGNLGYLIPYLRSGICFGKLRIPHGIQFSKYVGDVQVLRSIIFQWYPWHNTTLDPPLWMMISQVLPRWPKRLPAIKIYCGLVSMQTNFGGKWIQPIIGIAFSGGEVSKHNSSLLKVRIQWRFCNTQRWPGLKNR